MTIYSIYKATNLSNGKCYIGFAVNFIKRIEQHKKYFNKKKTKFYDAIKSYGWDNFEWQEIYSSKDGEYCLNVMESFFIEEYNSYYNGYNMTLGGGGTLGISNKGKIKHTQQTKKLMSEIKTGTNHSFETKQKISKTLKGRPASNKVKQNMKDNNPSKVKVVVNCPFCNKSGSYVIMQRWHFKNCKFVVPKQHY